MSDFISEFEFCAHHLPETNVLDLSLINQSISECSAFILKYRKQIDNKTVELFKYYSNLYKDYSQWNEEVIKLNFQPWCIRHDKKYYWVNPDYI